MFKIRTRVPAPENVTARGVRVAARGVQEEIRQVASLDVLFLRGHVREVQLPSEHTQA